MSPLRAVPDGPHDGDAAGKDGAPHDEGRSYLIADGPSNVTWLRSELGSSNLPGVFLRGGQLVYVASVTDAGYIAPRHPEDDNGPATVVPLTALALSTRIGDHYGVEKWDARKQTARPAHFPEKDCQRAMETPDELPYVRPLNGVTHTPVARAKGGILQTPGYDDESGYLLEPNVIVEPVSGNPTEEDVANATAFVRHLVKDFVWGDAHSEVNFWGAMLTPLLRLACPPPYKLIAITARERGSGKSLLARLMRIAHGGSLSTWPGNDEEVHKVISSKLYCTTAPIMQIDNVRGTLASGRLEALATTARYDVRVLGSTNDTSLVNDRLWVFTGNNMTIGGDLGRRMLWIDIDPQVEKPELRTGFAIPDLPCHVESNRGRILGALLTWIAGWDAAGRPIGQATSDCYGRWVATVRSILQIAGVPGTFAAPNPEREAVANADEAEWGEFLAALHGVYGNRRWTTKELTDRMDRATTFPFTGPQSSDDERIKDALPDELAARAARTGLTNIKKSLGKWVGNRKGQWHHGHTVLDAGLEPGTKSTYWQVFHKDDPAYQERRRPLGEQRRGSS